MDNGKEHGNCCGNLGLYRDNGKEQGNYHIIGFLRLRRFTSRGSSCFCPWSLARARGQLRE